MKLPELRALLENCHDARIRDAAPALLACEEALQELYDMVQGECPSLLEDDFRDDMVRDALRALEAV